MKDVSNTITTTKLLSKVVAFMMKNFPETYETIGAEISLSLYKSLRDDFTDVLTIAYGEDAKQLKALQDAYQETLRLKEEAKIQAIKDYMANPVHGKLYLINWGIGGSYNTNEYLITNFPDLEAAEEHANTSAQEHFGSYNIFDKDEYCKCGYQDYNEDDYEDPEDAYNEIKECECNEDELHNECFENWCYYGANLFDINDYEKYDRQGAYFEIPTY